MTWVLRSMLGQEAGDEVDAMEQRITELETRAGKIEAALASEPTAVEASYSQAFGDTRIGLRVRVHPTETADEAIERARALVVARGRGEQRADCLECYIRQLEAASAEAEDKLRDINRRLEHAQGRYEALRQGLEHFGIDYKLSALGAWYQPVAAPVLDEAAAQ